MLALLPYAWYDPPSRQLLMPDTGREALYFPDPHGWEFCSIDAALRTLGEEWERRTKLDRYLPGDDSHGRVLEDGRGLWVARLEG